MGGNDCSSLVARVVIVVPHCALSSMKNELRYFIYARKSSEGADRQMLSIEGQLGEIHHVVARNQLTVVGTFTESKSAHIPDNRPVFRQMIKQIRKGDADGIIVWHVNRISRNPKESGEVQQLLQDGIIKSIVLPHREYRSEDNALLFSIETSEANQYSRDLSVNVRRGLKQKYEMGHPPGIAPLGYLNTKSSIRGSNKIVVDPERWHIIRKGFDLMLSGTYSVSQIQTILNNEYGLRTRPGNLRGGRPLSKAGIYRLFTDHFYYGYFYRNGILYKGAYPPLITVHEFDSIQLLLGRQGRPRNKKHIFPFTGFIRCGICGSAITATQKQKFIKSTGLVKTFTFYHCTRRKKGTACTERSYLTAKQLEELVVQEFIQYQTKEPFVQWAMRIAKTSYLREINKYRLLVKSQQEQEQRLEREISNLIDLRIAGSITEPIFLQKKREKEEMLVRAQARTKYTVGHSQDWLSQLEQHLKFAANLVENFKNGDVHFKKKVCQDFGRNWTLTGKKLFVTKVEWLEPIKKYTNAVNGILSRLEPENSIENKEQNHLFRLLSPLVCGLVDEVRTAIHKQKQEFISKIS